MESKDWLVARVLFRRAFMILIMFWFTFTAIAQSPGGVVGNTMWLKADAQVKLAGNIVTSGVIDEWENVTGTAGASEFIQSSGTPQLQPAQCNFNPSVSFDGVNAQLSLEDVEAAVLFDDQNNTIFWVANLQVSPGLDIYCGWESDSQGDRIAYLERLSTGTGRRLSSDILSNPVLTQGDVVDTDHRIIRNCSSNSQLSVGIDGTTEATATGGSSITTVGNIGDFSIGCRPISASFGESQVSEMIIYPMALNNNQIVQIESYLGIKYGITLDNSNGGVAGDYVSSANQVLWDASEAPDYHNSVIGIGRDDGSGLLQKQSITADDSLRVYISSLATTNLSNVGNIAVDESFLIIGHDGGYLDDRSLEAPAGITSRLDREWKVTNTNFGQNFSIQLDYNTNGVSTVGDIRLLVDDDGDFTDAIVYDASSGLNFSNGVINIAVAGISNTHIPVNSTRYITIGYNGFGALPVSLVHFLAKKEHDYVSLEWQTASETNNSHFVVQRSFDTQGWTDLGEVAGQGTTLQSSDYKFGDKNPPSGYSYYRLKQVDFDGAFSYSPIKSVFYSNESNRSLVIAPNPFASTLQISTTDGSELGQLQIFTSSGLEISDSLDVARLSNEAVSVDFSDQPQGMYLVVNGEERYRVIYATW